MRVGLLGGSFDPPHQGHRLVATMALKKLQLDRVWCLVSPQNPLKDRAATDIATRLAAAKILLAHPRIDVLDLESRLGTQYSIDTIRALKARYPSVHFVWLIGADNMAHLHHWRGWREIMETLPLAVYPRPNKTLRAGLSVAAQTFAAARQPAETARQLAHRAAPAWTLLSGPVMPISSTALRQQISVAKMTKKSNL